MEHSIYNTCVVCKISVMMPNSEVCKSCNENLYQSGYVVNDAELEKVHSCAVCDKLFMRADDKEVCEKCMMTLSPLIDLSLDEELPYTPEYLKLVPSAPVMDVEVDAEVDADVDAELDDNDLPNMSKSTIRPLVFNLDDDSDADADADDDLAPPLLKKYNIDTLSPVYEESEEKCIYSGEDDLKAEFESKEDAYIDNKYYDNMVNIMQTTLSRKEYLAAWAAIGKFATPTKPILENIVECPLCHSMLEIVEKNCKIFRCAMRKNLGFANPHATLDDLIKERSSGEISLGCLVPLVLVDNGSNPVMTIPIDNNDNPLYN